MDDQSQTSANDHEEDKFNLELSICNYQPCDLPSDYELVR